MAPQRSLQEQAIDEAVDLVPYDVRWASMFAVERHRLLSLFPIQLLAVEHFGSTAVPGMLAKPVVDILAGVESMSAADALFASILKAGYTTSREFNEMLPDRRWFMRSAKGRRTHHLHIVVLGGAAWTARLRFRDCLRASPTLAQSYAGLKSKLATRFRHDREAYTDAKSEFVMSVLHA